jgi:hypothetical protein
VCCTKGIQRADVWQAEHVKFSQVKPIIEGAKQQLNAWWAAGSNGPPTVYEVTQAILANDGVYEGFQVRVLFCLSCGIDTCSRHALYHNHDESGQPRIQNGRA